MRFHPKNQLAMGGVTHKLYIHTQALEFCQCGTNPTFIFQLALHVWAINKALQVHTIFQMGMVVNQDRAPHSDTMSKPALALLYFPLNQESTKEKKRVQNSR